MLIITVIFIVTTHFANQLKRHFDKLNTITEQIKEQNLNISPEYSNFKEFDDVIESLIEMKNALQESLEAQWHMEKSKNEQIGALAHDVKIPMTIIKGNAELLGLSSQSGEQSDYIGYILNAANKIEQYIDQLIHISKTEEAFRADLKRVQVKELVNSVIQEMTAYIGSKSVEIVRTEHNLDSQEATIDRQLLQRALMNILSNANSTIRLTKGRFILKQPAGETPSLLRSRTAGMALLLKG